MCSSNECCLATAIAAGNATAIAITPVGALGDPHLALAHGGEADFRGEHGAFFNFLSASNVSLNARFKNASFSNGWQAIDGTYITEAHIIARTTGGSLFKISYHSDMIRAPSSKGERPGVVNSTCTLDKMEATPQHLDIGDVGKCDDVVAAVNHEGALTVTTREWKIDVKPDDVYHSGKFTTWSHKINLGFEPLIAEADMQVKPHGIIGQSFDGDNVGVNGKKDPYSGAKPGPKLTTSAMAEGAIEGDAYDYKMPSKFATEFKYSRFGRLSAPFRNVDDLKGTKVNSKVQKTAGALNRREGEVHLSTEL